MTVLLWALRSKLPFGFENILKEGDRLSQQSAGLQIWSVELDHFFVTEFREALQMVVLEINTNVIAARSAILLHSVPQTDALMPNPDNCE